MTDPLPRRQWSMPAAALPTYPRFAVAAAKTRPTRQCPIVDAARTMTLRKFALVIRHVTDTAPMNEGSGLRRARAIEAGVRPIHGHTSLNGAWPLIVPEAACVVMDVAHRQPHVRRANASHDTAQPRCAVFEIGVFEKRGIHVLFAPPNRDST